MKKHFNQQQGFWVVKNIHGHYLMVHFKLEDCFVRVFQQYQATTSNNLSLLVRSLIFSPPLSRDLKFIKISTQQTKKGSWVQLKINLEPYLQFDLQFKSQQQLPDIQKYVSNHMTIYSIWKGAIYIWEDKQRKQITGREELSFHALTMEASYCLIENRKKEQIQRSITPKVNKKININPTPTVFGLLKSVSTAFYDLKDMITQTQRGRRYSDSSLEEYEGDESHLAFFGNTQGQTYKQYKEERKSEKKQQQINQQLHKNERILTQLQEQVKPRSSQRNHSLQQFNQKPKQFSKQSQNLSNLDLSLWNNVREQLVTPRFQDEENAAQNQSLIKSLSSISRSHKNQQNSPFEQKGENVSQFFIEKDEEGAIQDQKDQTTGSQKMEDKIEKRKSHSSHKSDVVSQDSHESLPDKQQSVNKEVEPFPEKIDHDKIDMTTPEKEDKQIDHQDGIHVSPQDEIQQNGEDELSDTGREDFAEYLKSFEENFKEYFQSDFSTETQVIMMESDTRSITSSHFLSEEDSYHSPQKDLLNTTELKELWTAKIVGKKEVCLVIQLLSFLHDFSEQLMPLSSNTDKKTEFTQKIAFIFHEYKTSQSEVDISNIFLFEEGLTVLQFYNNSLSRMNKELQSIRHIVLSNLVQRNFQIQVQRSQRCLKCDKVKLSYEYIWSLELPVSFMLVTIIQNEQHEKNQILVAQTLKNCFMLYNRPTLNKQVCTFCLERSDLQIQDSIFSVSKYLLIGFSKWKLKNKFEINIRNPLKANFQEMFSPQTKFNDPYNNQPHHLIYRLQGMITSDQKVINRRGNKYFFQEDHQEIEEKELLRQKSELLCYEILNQRK